MKNLLASLFIFLLSSTTMFSQSGISGRIKADGDLLGLSGVMVKVKGTDMSTITDVQGDFSLQVPSGATTLIVEMEGYERQEIEIGNRSVIDASIVKSVGSKSIADQVSVGYGTLSKSEMTSSVAQVRTEDLGSQPVINLEQANQGRASGVLVQGGGGELGAANSVLIRGGSSLTASNAPLYVVDGVPLTSGNQSDINPNNIESIEVLKDASAAAIYGSRAANGVVLIQTKSGVSGKMKVDVDYQFGLGQVAKKLDLYSPREFKIQFIEAQLRLLTAPFSLIPDSEKEQIRRDLTRENLEAWVDTGENTVRLSDGSTINLLPAYDSLDGNTDWQNEVFRLAQSHRANFNISGGSANMNYFGGLSYLSQEGILAGNDFGRFNAQLNLSSRLSDKLNANMNFSFARTTNNRLNEDADLGNPIQAIVLPPADRYRANNNYQLDVFTLFYNPLTEINFSDFFETGSLGIGNFRLGYDIHENLTFNVEAGIDFSNDRIERRQGPETLDGAPSGLSRLTEFQVFNYLTNGYFNYSKRLASNNKMSIVLGASYQNSSTTTDFRQAQVNSIAQLESLPEGDPSLLNNPVPGSASAIVSSFTRINYAIQDKYILQLSGRMDGSSRFSENNQYGYFPAFSAGWNMSNENFLKNNPSISFLKLKGSYGLIGNSPQDDFLYRINYFLVNYGNQPGLRVENLSNPDLKWETTSQLDIGIDFGFLEDKLSGSVNYYIKNTTDLLFPKPVSLTTGFSSVTSNIASLENKGWEFSLSTVNLRRNFFSWTTDFNISSNINIVNDLQGDTLIVGVNAFLENEAAGAFFMPVYAGVNTATGEALYEDGNGGTTTNYNTALASGRRVVGNPNPKLFGGISNTLNYKNITLQFLFQFVSGVDIYNQTGEILANSGYQSYGQRSDQADRWYQAGDNATYPVLNPLQENTNPSSRWLEDGSYIRLNNLTLTYNLSDEVLNNWGLTRFSFFVGGQNLVTFTKYKGYDPDVNSVDPQTGVIGQNILRGLDNFTSPQPRTFITGLKIGF